MDFPRPSLTLVTGQNLYRRENSDTSDPLSLIDASIAGGVDFVQLRVNTNDSNDLAVYAVAMRLRELTAGRAHFIITGDMQLAEKCHADGILLPESSYKPADVKSFLRAEYARVVGNFVQSVQAAARAERGGADYVQVGPAYDIESDTTGLILIRKIKDAVHVPVIAFGGIMTIEHIVECLQAGADGIAVTEAITRAKDPMAAARELRTTLDNTWHALYP